MKHITIEFLQKNLNATLAEASETTAAMSRAIITGECLLLSRLLFIEGAIDASEQNAIAEAVIDSCTKNHFAELSEVLKSAYAEKGRGKNATQ